MVLPQKLGPAITPANPAPEGKVNQTGRVALFDMRPSTGPRALRGLPNYASANGIQIDVGEGGDEMVTIQ